MPECYSKIHIYKNLDKELFPYGIEVDCGKCLNCKANIARTKAMRMLHEYETYFNGKKEYKITFITFTYSDEEIYRNNGIPSLSKEWIRKQRNKVYARLYRKYKKKLDRSYIQYKYMIAGEYGGRGTQRPHYHMILLTRKHHSKIVHQFVKELAGGRTEVIKDASVHSIFYTAGYVAKKLETKERSEEEEEPFLICSRGLGKEWCLQNSEEMKKNYFIQVPTSKGTIKVGIPRIYQEWLVRYYKWSKKDIDDYRYDKRNHIEYEKEKEALEVINKVHKKLNIEEWNVLSDMEIRAQIYKDNLRDIAFEDERGVNNYYLNHFYNSNREWYNSAYKDFIVKKNKKLKELAIRKLRERSERRNTNYVDFG